MALSDANLSSVCRLASSRAARLRRSSTRQARVRGAVTLESAPFNSRLSSVKEAEQEAVVSVRRSDWERVTEMELLVGRLRVASRFPQYLPEGIQLGSKQNGIEGNKRWKLFSYLTTAMLTGAVVLAR